VTDEQLSRLNENHDESVPVVHDRMALRFSISLRVLVSPVNDMAQSCSKISRVSERVIRSFSRPPEWYAKSMAKESAICVLVLSSSKRHRVASA
jgi:hypothetical protein